MSNDGLSRVAVELEWEGTTADGGDFDLEASVTILDENGRVREPNDFVRYSRAGHAQGAQALASLPVPNGGKAKNYSEQVPTRASRIVVAVSIRDAKARGLTFSKVQDATIRVVDRELGEEIIHFDLSEDFSDDATVLFGEFFKQGDAWQFQVVGQGSEDDIPALARGYGV
ncbi:MAG TPA: TerD family protein [Fibrobacteria bacterium]|nr:TerD family protein [Fibrobacteria bacterium]